MQISVKGDAADIIRDLGVTQKLANKAAVTALNKTNDKIFTQSRRSISKTTGIAQKHIKSKFKKYRANRFSMSAKTWMGLKTTIPVRRLVKTKRGAGKYIRYLKESLNGKSLDDAFIAKTKSGHIGLFVRKGRQRLPIQEVAIDLSKVASPIIESIGDSIGPKEFKAQFIYDLKRRLKK